MTESRPSIAAKRRAFQELHRTGCFVMPNPWDIGSARFLQGLGFKALATTSSGFAWSQGRQDGDLSLDMALAHLRQLVEASDVPLNADFENGFASDAAGVAANVRLAIETGVAGLSIEDFTGNGDKPLFEVDTAVERIRAARSAIDRAGGDVVLVGRTEGFLHGRPDLNEAIVRLKAYASAGADCLYAPGLRSRGEIASVVAAVTPKPVNVLIGWASDLTVADITALGARRISVGGALARSAWAGFIRAAKNLAEQGRFDGFKGAATSQEIADIFLNDRSQA